MKSINTIRQYFVTLRKQEKIRHRDIARKLNISEGELIGAHTNIELSPSEIGEIQAIRLVPEWSEMISVIEFFGEVMALTRNEPCVHEKIGVYQHASKQGSIGLLVGEIDLRIFYETWAHGFAVHEMAGDGLLRSLQFFDKAGIAVHKIYLKPQSIIEMFDALVAKFKSSDQTPGIQVLSLDEPAVEIPDREINVKGFHKAWRDMKDTHEFYGLLRKFNVSRTQGLRLAQEEFAQEISVSAVRDLLDLAVNTETSIMVFVGNPGMIQIHSGPVKNFVHIGAWLNILDSRFNLHLREDHVAKVWVVRKPTIDGIVTSVELFNKEGEAIAMFFGERKPGNPELDSWRSLVQGLVEKLATEGA